MQHVRVPGMLHGRVVRPRGQRAYGVGARVAQRRRQLRSAVFPARALLRRGDFSGVVAENEWDAVRAARELRSSPGTSTAGAARAATGSTSDMRVGEGRRGSRPRSAATSARAFASAAHVVSRSVTGPVPGARAVRPNCAVADVKADSALVMCSTQDVYGTRRTLATLLGLPAEKVRVQYYEGSGTYGHSCYDDAAQAAALMSQARRQAGARAVHALGRARLGQLRSGPRRRGARGRRRRRQARRVRIPRLAAQLERHGDFRSSWPASPPPNGAEALPQRCPGRQSPHVRRDVPGPNLRLVNHQAACRRVPEARAGCDRRSICPSRSRPSRRSTSSRTCWASIRTNSGCATSPTSAGSACWMPRRRPPSGRRVRAAVPRGSGKVVAGRGIGLGTHLQSWGGAVADIEVNTETGKWSPSGTSTARSTPASS